MLDFTWGSTDINERGDLVFNYLLGTKLLLCNRSSKPTFINRNRQEALDITLVSEKLRDTSFRSPIHWMHNWRECDRVENFMNHRKTYWQMHLQELKKRISLIPPFRPWNKEDLDIRVKQFTDSCRTALEVACPTTRSRERIRPPWWSPVFKSLQTDCRKKFNIAKLP